MFDELIAMAGGWNLEGQCYSPVQVGLYYVALVGFRHLRARRMHPRYRTITIGVYGWSIRSDYI